MGERSCETVQKKIIEKLWNYLVWEVFSQTRSHCRETLSHSGGNFGILQFFLHHKITRLQHFLHSGGARETKNWGSFVAVLQKKNCYFYQESHSDDYITVECSLCLTHQSILLLCTQALSRLLVKH